MPAKKRLSIGIYSINRVFEGLWLETPKIPSKWAKCARFPCENANLPHCACFTRLRVYGGVNLVAHDCGYPLSRYTCRATRVAADFLDFIAFCRCSTGVALHPLQILVSHLHPPLCREVSHRNLGLKRCRARRGCRSYSCGCRATLCN